jgi:cell filamentation protein
VQSSTIKGAEFNLAHMQRIHKHLFGDVYEWAGEIRDVDISKGNTRFANCRYIASEAEKLSSQLAGENFLSGLPIRKFADRAGYYMGEWNVLHPFREGNGRTLREFTGQLANQAGYELSWTGITQQQMTEASIQAFRGDASMMADLLFDGLSETGRSVPKALQPYHDRVVNLRKSSAASFEIEQALMLVSVAEEYYADGRLTVPGAYANEIAKEATEKLKQQIQNSKITRDVLKPDPQKSQQAVKDSFRRHKPPRSRKSFGPKM